LSMETRLMLSTVPMRKRLKQPLPRIRRRKLFLNSIMTWATVMWSIVWFVIKLLCVLWYVLKGFLHLQFLASKY
jgi:hypothetical protein